MLGSVASGTPCILLHIQYNNISFPYYFTFIVRVVKDSPWNAAFQINYLQWFTDIMDKLFFTYMRLRL